MAHKIGILSMVQDPECSVVDTNLKFYHLQNVYACNMLVMLISVPMNLSLILVALALCLVDHLVEISSV